MSLWGFTAVGEGDTNKLWQRFDVSGYNAVLVSFDWVFDFYDGLSGAKDVFILILRDFDQ
jgi:hypothetical protein